MKRETLLLKLVIIVLCIPVLALAFVGLPRLIIGALQTFPNNQIFVYMAFISIYLSAIPFFIAVVQAFKLLLLIDKNKAFSTLAVKNLTKIKFSAFLISGLYLLTLPLFYMAANITDAPGIIFIGIVVIFAAFIIAIFSAVLEKLLQNAISIKSENDLTI
ncbi:MULTISPECIES: DUF2975 domain-containing protein [Listeria]|uniref:DUF2975 domain-containing protein n=1 Tax=Listeria TaxID=1637 RepID=UPI000B58E000|nr:MULTISPECIES: DUF2975 domain-containing protein [Listeria]